MLLSLLRAQQEEQEALELRDYKKGVAHRRADTGENLRYPEVLSKKKEVVMEQVITEERVKRERRFERTSQPEDCQTTECLKRVWQTENQSERTRQSEDCEMTECLKRVWQTENRMAPHGMDKFAKRPEENQ
jgi:hypothetical protein